jgi:hypothetical protein
MCEGARGLTLSHDKILVAVPDPNAVVISPANVCGLSSVDLTLSIMCSSESPSKTNMSRFKLHIGKDT